MINNGFLRHKYTLEIGSSRNRTELNRRLFGWRRRKLGNGWTWCTFTIFWWWKIDCALPWIIISFHFIPFTLHDEEQLVRDELAKQRKWKKKKKCGLAKVRNGNGWGVMWQWSFVSCWLVRGAVHSVCCTCAFRGNRKQMTVEKRSAEEEGERKRKVNEAGGETLNRKWWNKTDKKF